MTPVVTAITCYPVKSLAGGDHAAAIVHPWGLAQDRRWMVVDPQGQFLTQREHPRMALLHAAADGSHLTLCTPGQPPLSVPIAPPGGITDTPQGALTDTPPGASTDTPPGAVPVAPADAQPGAACTVRIWRDIVQARDCGDAAALWLSEALGTPCRLVHLADTSARRLRPDYAGSPAEPVSFADGFPLLLTAQASLDDLNARLSAPIPMARFRPNLTIAGAPAWAEDTWRRIRIGTAIFRVAKPCDRCVVTTIDPATALQTDPKEPLRTLALFRKDLRGGVMFGQNLVPEQPGHVRVADPVLVLETGPANVVTRSS